MSHGFELLWEGGSCLVVGKPAGLLTQAPPGIDSLEVRIKRYLTAREALAAPPYLAVIHRLDRPASGVLVFARRINAARKLSLQFEHREVRKLYWVLVEGRVEPAEGVWRDWLRKVDGEPRSEAVTSDTPGAQEAVLRYRVRQQWANTSWLEIELETGRTHQIRVQCAVRGHSVLGDQLYHSSVPFGPATEDERARWIALHAYSLAFVEPATKAPVEVTQEPNWEWPETPEGCGT
ncbi:MAG: RNA pseudouridine synthase [Pirellulales bacterium]